MKVLVLCLFLCTLAGSNALANQSVDQLLEASRISSSLENELSSLSRTVAYNDLAEKIPVLSKTEIKKIHAEYLQRLTRGSELYEKDELKRDKIFRFFEETVNGSLVNTLLAMAVNDGAFYILNENSLAYSVVLPIERKNLLRTFTTDEKQEFARHGVELLRTRISKSEHRSAWKDSIYKAMESFDCGDVQFLIQAYAEKSHIDQVASIDVLRAYDWQSGPLENHILKHLNRTLELCAPNEVDESQYRSQVYADLASIREQFLEKKSNESSLNDLRISALLAVKDSPVELVLNSFERFQQIDPDGPILMGLKPGQSLSVQISNPQFGNLEADLMGWGSIRLKVEVIAVPLYYPGSSPLYGNGYSEDCRDEKDDMTVLARFSTSKPQTITLTYEDLKATVETDFSGTCASKSGYVLAFNLVQEGRIQDDPLAFTTIDLVGINQSKKIKKPLVDYDRECGLYGENFCKRSNAGVDLSITLK